MNRKRSNLFRSLILSLKRHLRLFFMCILLACAVMRKTLKDDDDDKIFSLCVVFDTFTQYLYILTHIHTTRKRKKNWWRALKHIHRYDFAAKLTFAPSFYLVKSFILNKMKESCHPLFCYRCYKQSINTFNKISNWTIGRVFGDLSHQKCN